MTTENLEAAPCGPVALNDVLGWQPIETAPKDGTLILVCSQNGAGHWMEPAVMRWTGKLCNPWQVACLPRDHDSVGRPKIWIPIPELP